jgi:hypothetical protein
MRVTSDEAMLAEWRSWLDKDAMPPEWHRNLWDEFYALQHRRDQWWAFREMLSASAKDAQWSARWFSHVTLRNYIEAQTSALRRFAYAGYDPRPVSFGKIVRGIAKRPSMFGEGVSAEAARDLAEMTAKVEAADTFADKFVAHLDPDHATAVPPQTLAELDETVAFLSPLWGRWYERIVGKGVDTETIPETGWASFLRLVRVPGPYERLMRVPSDPGPLGIPDDVMR